MLCKKRIETIDDLDSAETAVKEKLDLLIKERRCVYNKIRRCKNPDTKEKLQQDVTNLSKEIKGLRKEVKLYEDIRTRSISMKSKLKEIRKREDCKATKKNEKEYDDMFQSI